MNTRRKKIAIFTNTSTGLYLFRMELLKELLLNFDVATLTSDTGHTDDLKDLGVNCHIIDIDKRGTNPIKDIKLFLNYCLFIQNNKPDYVINYTIKPNIYGGIACRIHSIPYSCNVTGLGTAFEKQGVFLKLIELLYKAGCRQATSVFFENSYNQDLFLRKRIINKEQAVLLNGAGVNLKRFYYAEYPETDNTVRFLFMGRIMKEKGVNELLKAATMLHENGVNFSLDIIGSYEEDYQDEFKLCSEEGWLNYYGFQSDVKPFISACHCFVLPSWHEGMANTNLECAAMGRPVITCNIPGCREAVVDGESGYLCNPKDYISLFDAMKKFIALSYEKKKSMGIAGRKHMELFFSKTAVVEKTVKELFRSEKQSWL